MRRRPLGRSSITGQATGRIPMICGIQPVIRSKGQLGLEVFEIILVHGNHFIRTNDLLSLPACLLPDNLPTAAGGSRDGNGFFRTLCVLPTFPS
jgi:hypothetical protein